MQISALCIKNKMDMQLKLTMQLIFCNSILQSDAGDPR